MQANTVLKAAALALTASLLLFTGCGVSGGSRNVQETTSTTKGQELMDLKKAHDAGIITDKEFDKMKKKIMDKD